VCKQIRRSDGAGVHVFLRFDTPNYA
jgi:hypothetical protein